MYKVAFKNLGCKVNSYETMKMRENIPHNFYEVNFKDIADVYIINTCSVTHVADKKSRQMIHQARKRNKNALMVVCGCYVDNIDINNENINEIENENIIYVRNSIKNKVWEKILEKSNANFKDNDSKKYSKLNKNEISNLSEEERVRGFLKIEDGCNNFCSYCIIPYLRGRIKSRKIDDIIKDAKNMVKNGKKEIVLTGIDINAYGMDFENNTNNALFNVIEAVCNIDGVLRVRIGSLHPFIITEDFIKSLFDVKKNKNLNKFCPEFHISLQSGSDEVLKNMNRKYTIKEYEKAVNIVRKYFKNATITTDIIVGFPKETDKNFIETCNFVKKIKFYNPHIFKYSIRKGTIAANMPQVDDIIKEKREKILIDLCKKISDDIRKKQNKKTKEVLVEEIQKIDGKYCAIGFTKEYMKAYAILDKPYNTKVKRDKLVGRLINVTITNSNNL